MHVVIVESPSKAKTINKYLGKDYKVLASYGHVRDLPSKDGAIDPDNGFAMQWQADRDSSKRLTEIAAAVKGAERLYLATDPDREGEAISWHVMEVLAKKKALKDVEVKRVVFNQITKSAILKAMAEPRDLDQPLVNAYLARRGLDYLVGFTLSPVLWRKLPGARSAGRVQSVALRLVCEREAEIEAFTPREFWSVETALKSGDAAFTARLVGLDGNKLGKFDLPDDASAKAAAGRIEAAALSITGIERKPAKRNPAPPFTTSTLQQEAARKLRFTAQQTMQVAQRLYEGKSIGGEVTGLITYMRTDGVSMAEEAIQGARRLIASRYGETYLPETPRRYKSKAKNAQEAHEAIRPTDPARTPSSVASTLDADEKALYDLIWRRTIASQMEAARYERTAVTIEDSGKSLTLRANGSVVVFDGYLGVYEEGKDDSQRGDDDKRLPPLSEGASLLTKKVTPSQHFTEAPPRYSEASLVKKLEELGIGRPSTYAAILSKLRERDYVTMDKGRFFPHDKGRLVTAFLEKFFEQYVEYDFTADLEEKLDEISDGKRDWQSLLTEFWHQFKPKTEEVIGTRNSVVIDVLDEFLAPMMFTDEASRACPSCADGRLGLKVSRHGAFIGCSNYPECRHTRPFGKGITAGGSDDSGGQKSLGADPASGIEIEVKAGRYGPYIERAAQEDGAKPDRASIPKDMDPGEITLETALKLLSLPREVGNHPESGKMIVSAIGRYGPYLNHDGQYARLSGTEEVFSVGLNRAVTLLAEAATKKRGGTKTILKDLGEHPDGGIIQVLDGRYGPYVNHGKINATLPKDSKPEDVTLEQALELIAAKAAKKGPGRRAAPKKAAPKKTAAKKPAAKKPAARKSAATKSATTKSATRKPAAKKAASKKAAPKKAAAKSPAAGTAAKPSAARKKTIAV